jgi:hypothetical protein
MDELEHMEQPEEVVRSHSTWKVLGGLFLAVVFAFLLLGLCVSALVSSTPHHSLEIARTDLDFDLPRFYPQPSFGADADGHTFGVWVVLHRDSTADAFYSRDPRSACNLPWRAEMTVEGTTGVFQDPCQGGTYDRTGKRVFGPAVRDIDEYDTEVSDTTVTIDLERLRLGECPFIPEAERVTPCSEPGNPRYADKQPTLPPAAQ